MDFQKLGRIKYSAGKVFQSQYDNTLQQNIVIEFPDGTTERVYFPANDPTYTSFRKDQQVKVVWSKTDKGHMRKTVFALNQQELASGGQQAFAQPSVSPNPNYQQTKNPNTQNNLEFVIQRIKEFGIVFSLVNQKFPNFSEENKRAIANSILIEGRKEGRNFSTLDQHLSPPPLPNGQSINQSLPRPTPVPQQPIPVTQQQQTTQEIVPIEPPAAPAVAGYPNLPVPVKPVVSQGNANLNMLDDIPF